MKTIVYCPNHGKLEIVNFNYPQCPICGGPVTKDEESKKTSDQLCRICGENYNDTDNAGVCYTCVKLQLRKLIVKCERCGCWTARGRERGDKLDQVDDYIDKGLSDISDLDHNGFGFILMIRGCILCK